MNKIKVHNSLITHQTWLIIILNVIHQNFQEYIWQKMWFIFEHTMVNGNTYLQKSTQDRRPKNTYEILIKSKAKYW
jgi:hypothetical protein